MGVPSTGGSHRGAKALLCENQFSVVSSRVLSEFSARCARISVTVGHANFADIPDLLALQNECPTAAHWSRAQYEEALGDSGPRRLTLVAKEEGSITGFVVARVLNQEWEIENIMIASATRRRGGGTRLLRELLEIARKEDAEAIFLEVRESNRAARAFYEKLHFIQNGRRPRYYSRPQEDAMLYRLALK
jgi:ribosomal-protein-alanine acetyltransferase